MRKYDDPVEVRQGMVAGWEAPEQFLWRGRLWKVRDVVAHWVETGPWWSGAGMREVLGEVGTGTDPGTGEAAGQVVTVSGDLLGEREVWRVEAARGMPQASGWGHGVFDLVFDWATGSWRLVGCQD